MPQKLTTTACFIQEESYVSTCVELDKLHENDEKIVRALNYLGFRIFFKYSLHRSERCL